MDVLLRQVVATSQVAKRPLAKAAVCTSEFVEEVLVGLTGDADPAADVTRLHALNLVLPAGVTAL